MNAADIAKLAIVLAPIVKEFWVEGTKVCATFKDNISQDDLNQALELSKSAAWPELSFQQSA